MKKENLLYFIMTNTKQAPREIETIKGNLNKHFLNKE